MSSPDAVTEKVDERTDGLADSLAESLAPTLARHARSGNLAAASGAVSLLRAGRTFLKGNRKRGLLQAGVGLFWIAVALAQRRTGDRSDPRSDVVDTSPDLESAVEPGDHGTDHATGEEVVDTTDADVPSDDSSEVGVSSDLAEEVAGGQADQRDVVGTDEIESAASDGGDEEASGSDEESDGDGTDGEAESGNDDATTDDDATAETESAE